MKTKLLIVFIIIFLTLPIFTFGYKYEKTIDKSFVVDSNFDFELKNCNGNIDVATYKGNKILIKIRKYSNSSGSFEKTKVIFKKSDGKLKVSIKRPGNNCRTSFEFYIKLPRNLSLTVVETINGRIGADGIFGDFSAKTVNGRLSFEGVLDDAKFATVNGSIGVYLDKPLSGDLSIRSVNGSVKLELDKNSSFFLSSKTTNGSIKSDFGLHRTKRFIGSKMDGVVNDGKFDIKIQTVNGSVKVLED